jgi:hypothetical protein
MSAFFELTPKKIKNICSQYETVFFSCINDLQLTRKNTEYFESILKDNIDQVISQVNRQLEKYRKPKRISFITEQRQNFKDFLPRKRKEALYKRYLLWNVSSGDERILDDNYEHNEYHLGYFKNVFSVYENYYDNLKEKSNNLFELYIINTSTESERHPILRAENLRSNVLEFGFFELPKVKCLSESNKEELVNLISTKRMPYSIAMIDYLEFLKHLEKEHFKTKDKLHEKVATWFNLGKNKRAVKGNINVLSEHSTDNKTRYTSYLHKETVKKDYQKLK